MTQTIKASEFKSKCLHLMDEIAKTGEELIITKNGKPVSVLRPYRKTQSSLFGCQKDKIRSHDDLIDPVDIKWDVQ